MENCLKSIVEWGVPQGSVLGPLLFRININGVPLAVKSKILLHADDTIFLNTTTNKEHLGALLSESLKEASTWFSAN